MRTALNRMSSTFVRRAVQQLSQWVRECGVRHVVRGVERGPNLGWWVGCRIVGISFVFSRLFFHLIL